MYIIGAGMAGLLSGNILRGYNPKILEQQDNLPNNHHAVFRQRENKISKALGIPFKEVTIHKLINFEGNLYTNPQLNFSNEYSYKVTGRYSSRSINNLNSAKRYISPPDFIRRMSRGLSLNFSMPITKEFLKVVLETGEPIISTIPMPVLLDMLDIKHKLKFTHREIYTLKAKVNADCDLYQTVYYPNLDLPMYRMSITGDEIAAEFIKKPPQSFHERHGVQGTKQFIEHFLEHDFGIHTGVSGDVVEYESKYGKINSMSYSEDRERKKIIKHLTDEYGIYSVGRFAVWRNILLDDVYDDLQVVSRMIEADGYLT